MRQMHLGVILDGVGGANWGWLRPWVNLSASNSLEHYIIEAKIAEAAKLDFIFIADTMHITADSSPHFLNRFEPISLLGALAAATSRIGLVATMSTTYTEPFNLARQVGSLDMLSAGRAGWNIVTTGLSGAAQNFSQDKLPDISNRYAMAREHVEVVTGLWDTWEDDAFVRDRKNRRFFDPEKMHPLMHRGEFFHVDGPLNIARSPQGQPVLFQAGASENGRDLAARTADAIFGIPRSIEEALEYSADVRTRAAAHGRNNLLFFPRIDVVVAATSAEAEAKYREICELVDYDEALHWLTFFFSNHDFRQYDPDAPFPELGDVGHNAYRSVSDQIKRIAAAEKLTLREVARKFAVPRHDFIGSAEEVADACERWFKAGACDGFIIAGTLSRFEDFVQLVVPILQQRGLFRTEYEASTFRGNLGLEKVPNRYARPAKTSAAEIVS
jgi:FMN-dependent oxidoreductase (nitrilotriacetate monooxygenase family)